MSGEKVTFSKLGAAINETVENAGDERSNFPVAQPETPPTVKPEPKPKKEKATERVQTYLTKTDSAVLQEVRGYEPESIYVRRFLLDHIKEQKEGIDISVSAEKIIAKLQGKLSEGQLTQEQYLKFAGYLSEIALAVK
ncbi:hypothetical protein [Pseudoalteromonas rubra]|uniref:hypothetical protein n=1 Tax=Pseudoalteromonas rubra TaxID=43658 RepID=UPI002DC01088|nr:hypothetical protein [Pseudoalteromonas rubra]MEC4091623.1 hypothetical protein [Pseudoalteromonas rubra]